MEIWSEVGNCTSVRLRQEILDSATCKLLYFTENFVASLKLPDLNYPFAHTEL